jgi:hypothetical protein
MRPVSSYAVSRILDFCPHLSRKGVEWRLGYASFACVDRGFLYIEVPKAACTAIKTFLRSLYTDAPLRPFIENNRETRMDMFIHSRSNVPIPPITSLPDTVQRELFESPDALRFTVVRNPYTRLISAWRDKVLLREPTVEDVHSSVQGEITFEKFIAYIEQCSPAYWDDHWAKQVDMCFSHAIPFNHIGKVETLSKTARALNRHLGMRVALPIANSGALRIEPEFSEGTRVSIATLYADDFTEFGYDPDNFPRTLGSSKVSAAKFIHEIVERNLVIADLYAQRDRLRAQLEALQLAHGHEGVADEIVGPEELDS